MKIILISVFLFVLNNIIAQNKYLSSYPGFGVEIKDKTVYYNKYPKDYRIYGNYNSFEEFNSIYPEQTLKSILSAKNFNWDKKNYDYLIENNPIKYETSNKEVYFELLSKLTFNSNGLSYSIIKYYVNTPKSVIPSCSVLVRKNKMWYVINPTGSLSKIFLMFNYLSVISLNAIFENTSIGVDKFDQQIKHIYLEGILSLTKAINSISSSKMTDEELKIVLEPLFNN